MCMSEHSSEFTTISVTAEIRNKLRNKKRGGETYSDLLRSMAAQYDPEENN